MNRESLIRLKDSSLNLAQELAARMNGDETPTSDEFAWCTLYLQMHKAAVMELHFFPKDKSFAEKGESSIKEAIVHLSDVAFCDHEKKPALDCIIAALETILAEGGEA